MALEPETAAARVGAPPATDGAAPSAAAAALDPFNHPLIQDLMLNPSGWRLWPAVALLRWMLRDTHSVERLAYRSHPSLSFSPSEVRDLSLDPDRISLTLSAPGLASPGSALPTSDVERIVRDSQVSSGAMAAFLDGLTDRLMHAVEDAEARSNAAFCLAMGGRVEPAEMALDIVGRSAPLNVEPDGSVRSADPSEPVRGGVGLGQMFVGPTSAAGLEAIMSAFTGCPVRVSEFVPVLLPTAQRSCLGRPLGFGALGVTCEVVTGGVDVIIDGRDAAHAHVWTEDVRIRSLHTMARSYIGAPIPRARFFLDLNSSRVSPASLGEASTLGRMSLLGEGSGDLRIPLEL